MKSKFYLLKFIPLYFIFTYNLLAQPSLFFTDQELKIIHETIFLKSKSNETKTNYKVINLSAILYVDKNHWTLWLNDQVIHGVAPLPIAGFRIEKVTPHRVEFSWIPSHSTVRRRLTLRPRQVFLEKNDRIIPQP